jgi:hypothetical protein
MPSTQEIAQAGHTARPLSPAHAEDHRINPGDTTMTDVSVEARPNQPPSPAQLERRG